MSARVVTPLDGQCAVGRNLLPAAAPRPTPARRVRDREAAAVNAVNHAGDPQQATVDLGQGLVWALIGIGCALERLAVAVEMTIQEQG
jgi:hypothetical protein